MNVLYNWINESGIIVDWSCNCWFERSDCGTFPLSCDSWCHCHCAWHLLLLPFQILKCICDDLSCRQLHVLLVSLSTQVFFLIFTTKGKRDIRKEVKMWDSRFCLSNGEGLPSLDSLHVISMLCDYQMTCEKACVAQQRAILNNVFVAHFTVDR